MHQHHTDILNLGTQSPQGTATFLSRLVVEAKKSKDKHKTYWCSLIKTGKKVLKRRTPESEAARELKEVQKKPPQDIAYPRAEMENITVSDTVISLYQKNHIIFFWIKKVYKIICQCKNPVKKRPVFLFGVIDHDRLHRGYTGGKKLEWLLTKIDKSPL